MSKRKPMDKAKARERRNRLLETAAAAELSLTEGVREMRAIAGMTQDEFAADRGVSARVIKAIELGQGNPTVATLNRIGEFFGLEVAFVPIRRAELPTSEPQRTDVSHSPVDPSRLKAIEESIQDVVGRELSKMISDPEFQRKFVERLNKELIGGASIPIDPPLVEEALAVGDLPNEKKKKLHAR